MWVLMVMSSVMKEHPSDTTFGVAILAKSRVKSHGKKAAANLCQMRKRHYRMFSSSYL